MPRFPLYPRLTEHGLAEWQRFVDEHNVTTTALVEAIAEQINDGILPASVLERAHQIDNERNSRRRR